MKKSEIDKIDWLKNILAAAAILLLAGLYHILVKKEFQYSLLELAIQVIPDLIAALIIVLTIYYVFIRKGISSEEKLKDSIEDIIRSNINNNTFENEYNTIQEFNVGELIDNTQELLVIGYSCRFFISALQKELEKGIKNKMNLKIIIIEMESDASKLMMKYDSFEELEVDLKITKRKLFELNEKVHKFSGGSKIGKIEYRSIDWIPSCSLSIFQSKDGKNGVLKLKVYPVWYKTTLTDV